MRGQFLEAGPAGEVVEHHFAGADVGPVAGPEGDQQAGDDGAVNLDLDPGRVVAHQVLAAEQVFEEAEEQFDGPEDLMKLRKLPKKILGRKIPDEDVKDMGLDSSRKGP